MEHLIFIGGSMFGGKSKYLIDIIDEAHEDPDVKYLVFKPTKDTRDGLHIHSRVYDRVIQSLAWDQNYDEMKVMFEYTIAGFSLTNPHETKMVFFDESHFLSIEDVKYISDICVKYKVQLVMSGLETSFKLEEFESTKWLKENANFYMFFHGDCNSCGKDRAIYNILYDNSGNVIKDGESIRPGDQEYKVYCDSCIAKI